MTTRTSTDKPAMGATEYRLYVPAAGSLTHIDDGSAIVGEPEGDRIGVDFEGNRYGACNMQTFEDRITHAAGRRAYRYPTTARASYPADALIEVGTVRYDELMRSWIISDITDRQALQAWSPEQHVVGGSEELKSRAAGIRYSGFSPSEMTTVALKQSSGTPLIDAIFKVAADKDNHGKWIDR